MHDDHRDKEARSGPHPRPAEPATGAAPHGDRRWLVAAVIGLCGIAVWTLAPVLPWLIVAAWIAGLCGGLLNRLRSVLGDRGRAAAVLTTLLLIGLLAPIITVVAVIAVDLESLVNELGRSQGGGTALRMLVGSGVHMSARAAMSNFARTHREQLFSLGGAVLEHVAWTGLGLFVLVTAVYTFLADGRRIYDWWLDRAPIARPEMHRLANAFMETGRGLYLGVGVSGLYQALVATIAYLALGVPRALALGMATFLASLIPSIGTALVWAPVAAGLWLEGHTTSALVLIGVGVVLVSGVDHLLRPWLMQRGRLQLHLVGVLVAVVGGVIVMGPWGIALGPLAVRLGSEALAIARERGIFAPRTERERG